MLEHTHTHTHTHTRPREMDEMSENWGRVPAQRVMNGGEFVAFWTLFFFFARLFVFFFFAPRVPMSRDGDTTPGNGTTAAIERRRRGVEQNK